MKAIKWIPAVAIFVVSSALFAAESNDVFLSHYEPLQRLNIQPAGNNSDTSSQKAQFAAPVELSFDAMGRAFVLELEPNDRLFSGVARLLDGVGVYRGHLADRPDSWARIVVFEGVPRGLIWDGEELFAIEAPGDSLLQTSSPVIYRLADLLIAPGAMSCGVGASPSSGAAAFEKLTAELGTAVAQAPGAVTEITMGAIGDFEFTDSKGGDAAADLAITTRLNNVDGYFSEQVGIQINVQTVETFSNSNDPFGDTADASTLLNELSAYRAATPAQNAQGLTHLYTGRNLDTTTVGIAWRGTLCENFHGAGLSEGRGNATLDSLIAAHEIGHNFGAEHDGDPDPDSSCPSVPDDAYIMAPSVNTNNDQFSACSIAVMAAEAEAAGASCVAPLPTVDMAVALDDQVSTVLLGATTVLTYELVNNGTLPATNVAADFTLPVSLSLDSVTASAGISCTNGAGTVNCVIGDVPGVGSRNVTITTTPTSVGTGMLSATVTSDVDERLNNNQESVQITVDPAVELVVNAPASSSVRIDESTTVNAVLENRSTMSATGVTLTISLNSGIQPNSASWSIGTCTVTGQQIDCQAAGFAAQSSSTLSVGVTGMVEGNKNYTVTLSANEADADPANNSVNGTIRVNSPKDEGGGATGPMFLWVLFLISLFVAVGYRPGLDRSATMRGAR